MNQAPPVWTESFRVRAYEVDVTGRASVPALANWLQETAGNHATALGWAVNALQAKGRTWVLARLHLCLGHAPAWREDVRVTTWPSGVLRLYARLAGYYLKRARAVEACRIGFRRGVALPFFRQNVD